MSSLASPTRHWTDNLTRLGACDDAVAWARNYPTLRAAWRYCERGDWMLWLCGRVSGRPGDRRRRKLVACAAECAALAIPRVSDEYVAAVCTATVQTCLAWSVGCATDWELETARRAAVDAGYDAACDCVDDAAFCYADAAAYAACNAAYADTRKSADIVREWYPSPPSIKDRS